MGNSAVRPEVGKRYRASFTDCCIAGEFVASVTRVEEDDEFVYAVDFDNGVKLTETAVLVLEAVDG